MTLTAEASAQSLNLTGAAARDASPPPAFAVSFDQRIIRSPARPNHGTRGGILEVARSATAGGVLAAWWVSAFSAADVKFRYTQPWRKVTGKSPTITGTAAQASTMTANDKEGLYLNIAAELNLGFFDGGKVWTVGAGPQVVKIVNEKVAVYGHALAGFLRDAGATDFMLQPGAGVVFAPQGQKFLVTAGLDFPIDFFDGGSQRGTQLGAGVVFPLGH